jgi:hypothetical protein
MNLGFFTFFSLSLLATENLQNTIFLEFWNFLAGDTSPVKKKVYTTLVPSPSFSEAF